MKENKTISVNADVLMTAVQTITSHHPEWAKTQAWLIYLSKLIEPISPVNSDSPKLDLSNLFATYKEIDESELTGRVANELETLRSAYRRDPSQFSEEAVTQLQIVNSYIQTACDFEMELEDASYIVDRNDADELISRLDQLAAMLDEKSRLFLRIQKEIRELVERRQKLPSGAERLQSRKLAQARFTLEAQKKRCGHNGCDSLLTLREGNGRYFWGCKRFPDCWGRRPLTKEERQLIET